MAGVLAVGHTRSSLCKFSACRHMWCGGRVKAAPGPVLASPLLVRDFIWRALYGQGGYFTTTECLHTPPAPLPFRALRGQAAYTEKIAALYRAEEHAWLTPVEIFAPWYSYAVAHWILESHRHSAEEGEELQIFEVGGGAGTQARHTLDYLRENAPEVYQCTRYTDIEVSALMGSRATATVAGASVPVY